MISDVVLEFERVTKYPLLEFITRFRDFLVNNYPEIDDYFSGRATSISNTSLLELQYLTTETKDVTALFKNYNSRFSTCGYWELLELIDDLNTQVDKINKLPKFRRTSLTKRGYMPVIQTEGSVGGYRTVEDLANSVRQLNADNTDWIQIMLGNDKNEGDWEIDELSPMKVYINNQLDLVVSTVLDQPIGVRVYGRDILKKITFLNNDLERVDYIPNVEQKIQILLQLVKGDVPEDETFGRSRELASGSNFKQFSFPVLAKELQDTFLQNDLFDYISITNYDFKDGDLIVYCDIKTKYDYSTEQTVVI